MEGGRRPDGQGRNPGTDVPVPDIRTPVIEPGHTFATVTDKISAIVLTKRTPTGWWAGFGFSFTLVMLLFYAIGYLVLAGTGIWGVNIPVGFDLAITNFVWWVGIAHACTPIAAILALLRHVWRTWHNP